MRSIWLVADVHLTAAASPGNALFYQFINTIDSAKVSALFILGDLFDSWLGDDDTAAGADTLAALTALTGRGVALFIQHGNRDFLLGQRFCRACHATLLPDMYIYNDSHQDWLLTHGDLLVDDSAYLRYRRFIRHSLTLALIFLLPLPLRRWLATKMRHASRGNILVVLDDAYVTDILRRHQCRYVLHGHLHRKEEHRWQSDGVDFRRWCLPAWSAGSGGYGEIREGQLYLHDYLCPASSEENKTLR